MAVRFTITEKGDPRGSYTRSFLRDRVIVGRARLSDICLPDMAISTRHAEISLKGGGYAISDLGSLNGTRVNGKELVPHRKRTLKNDDVIGIASFELSFATGAMNSAREPRDASVIQARKILASILERSGSEQQPPTLAVTGGPNKGTRYLIPDPPAKLELGRNKDADLILEDRDCSRNHAEIIVEVGSIIVNDLKSRSGIFVEGERVESVNLEPGMHFRLGKTTIALEHPLQRSLSVIFEAPEEETSSYSMNADILSSRGEPVEEPTIETESDTAPETTPQPTEEISPPPVGPEDPLVASPDSPLGRTTANIPIQGGDMESRSDLGLIIIGCVIVVAAVLALVYLFT